MEMEIPELINLKCPQNWGFSQFKNIDDELSKKDPVWNEDEDYDEGQGSIPSYGTNIGRYLAYCHLSYECYRKGNYVDALENINQANVTDAFIKKYDTAFKHVVKASRAHILCKLKSVDKAKKIVNQLVKEKFSDKDEAAFKYIESKMVMHYGGPKRYEEALTLIKSAIKLVENEAEFCFNYGLILNRMRHFETIKKEPSPVEYNMLKLAMSLEGKVSIYAITLAQTYFDARYTVPYEKRKKCEQLAADFYWNLLEKHDILSGNEIARCVFNLMKIDTDNKPELEQYAKIAKKKNDSVLTNHYIGTFYLQNKQYTEVLDCFKSEVVKELTFLAGQVLLTRYRLNDNYLSEPELSEQIDEWSQMLTNASNKNKFIFYMSISAFYLIVMGDINNAASMFNHGCKSDVKEVFFINICQKYKTNYLCLLKRELNKCFLRDGDIIRAKEMINTLPEEITREMGKRIITPSLYALKQNIL